jgi:hypothetical protein
MNKIIDMEICCGDGGKTAAIHRVLGCNVARNAGSDKRGKELPHNKFYGFLVHVEILPALSEH